MTNIYYSPKRSRKYVRKFDYYEAQERYRSGESGPALAKEYGVSVSRIYQVITPGERDRVQAYQDSIYKGGANCIRCGAPTNLAARKLGAKLCIPCARDKRIAAHANKTVRDYSLWCNGCKRWLPDDAFGLYNDARSYRRGRHYDCRKCVARARRKRRHRAFAEGRARTLK